MIHANRHSVGGRRGMTVIQVQLASMALAEQVIAEIWTCLEEYNIPSPALSLRFHDRGRVTVAAHFNDAVAANTVLTRISTESLCRDPDRDPRLHILIPPHSRMRRMAAPPGWLLAGVVHSQSSFVSRQKRK